MNEVKRLHKYIDSLGKLPRKELYKRLRTRVKCRYCGKALYEILDIYFCVKCNRRIENKMTCMVIRELDKRRKTNRRKPDLHGSIRDLRERMDEAEKNIKEAIGFHIEGLKEDGLPVPEPSSFTEYIEV